MKIYNSDKEIEEIVLIEPGNIKIYCCGPRFTITLKWEIGEHFH